MTCEAMTAAGAHCPDPTDRSLASDCSDQLTPADPNFTSAFTLSTSQLSLMLNISGKGSKKL